MFSVMVSATGGRDLRSAVGLLMKMYVAARLHCVYVVSTCFVLCAHVFSVILYTRNIYYGDGNEIG
jgi:hypothetical protein